MRIKEILLGVAAGIPALFIIINWGVFSAHETFFFLFGAFNLSIGFVLAALLGFAFAAFFLYGALWRNKLLVAHRRQAKELEAQRALAATAEASRFTELTALMNTGLERQNDRFDQALDALGTDVREATNSLAAVLGEMDDRLRRTTDRTGN